MLPKGFAIGASSNARSHRSLSKNHFKSLENIIADSKSKYEDHHTNHNSSLNIHDEQGHVSTITSPPQIHLDQEAKPSRSQGCFRFNQVAIKKMKKIQIKTNDELHNLMDRSLMGGLNYSSRLEE